MARSLGALLLLVRPGRTRGCGGVGTTGAKNRPGTADGPDGEVMLDIEVAGSVAPGAAIAVYFAPNTDQGFIDAVSTAVHDTPDTRRSSPSAGVKRRAPWTRQAMNQMEQAFVAAAAMGVTVTVAAGDNGSTDGIADGLQHVGEELPRLGTPMPSAAAVRVSN